jgi:PQQ-dependent catabolism-associated CXXCW motif protein
MRFDLAVAVLSLALLLATGAAAEAPPAEPDDYRQDDFRSPVPLTLQGARVVDTDQVWRLLADAPRLVAVDVLPLPSRPPRLAADNIWLPPPHWGLPGAVWLPDVGYGRLSEARLRYFEDSLRQISDGDQQRPLLFYCRAACWMSWNAAKRALQFGYRHVLWYPDGIDGWQQAGRAVTELVPFAGGSPLAP